MDKIFEFKNSYLDSRKISNACALGTSIIIYMSYEISEPVPDIKIESHILAVYF